MTINTSSVEPRRGTFRRIITGVAVAVCLTVVPAVAAAAATYSVSGDFYVGGVAYTTHYGTFRYKAGIGSVSTNVTGMTGQCIYSLNLSLRDPNGARITNWISWAGHSTGTKSMIMPNGSSSLPSGQYYAYSAYGEGSNQTDPYYGGCIVNSTYRNWSGVLTMP